MFGQATQRYMSDMRIQVDDSSRPGLLLCRVQGGITRDALEKDESPEEQLGQTAMVNTILLDLSHSGEIDSVGVSWLIRFHSRCEKAKGRLIIHSMPSSIRRAFDLLNMKAILLLADNEQSARDLAAVDSA